MWYDKTPGFLHERLFYISFFAGFLRAAFTLSIQSSPSGKKRWGIASRPRKTEIQYPARDSFPPRKNRQATPPDTSSTCYTPRCLSTRGCLGTPGSPGSRPCWVGYSPAGVAGFDTKDSPRSVGCCFCCCEVCWELRPWSVLQRAQVELNARPRAAIWEPGAARVVGPAGSVTLQQD